VAEPEQLVQERSQEGPAQAQPSQGPQVASYRLTGQGSVRRRRPSWLYGSSEIHLCHMCSLSGCVTKQLKGK
jgi:hypothetical protein